MVVLGDDLCTRMKWMDGGGEFEMGNENDRCST